MSHPAASRIPLYIGEVYKPCVSGLFLDDIRLATCPVESHRVGLSDASHNTLDTQPLFKFFLMSSDSEALFDTLMNELIHQMSGQTAPLGNGHPRDIPATDPAPNSTLLIVYSLLIIEDRDAGFAQRDPEELGSSGLRVDCLDPVLRMITDVRRGAGAGDRSVKGGLRSVPNIARRSSRGGDFR